MASALPYAAFSALAVQLESLAGLSGRVRVVHADNEQAAQFPSVAIVPRGMTFECRAEEEIAQDVAMGAPDSQLLSVGYFTGDVELRVYAETAFEREKYEDLVRDLFLRQTDTEGTLIVAAAALIVGGVTLEATASVPCAFEMVTTEWRDEMVFDDARFSFVTLKASFPALVARIGGVYDIQTLVLQLTKALTGANPVIDDQVQVSADGTLTPYP